MLQRHLDLVAKARLIRAQSRRLHEGCHIVTIGLHVALWDTHDLCANARDTVARSIAQRHAAELERLQSIAPATPSPAPPNS